MKPRDLLCFDEVADVIGNEKAEVELSRAIKYLNTEPDCNEYLSDAFVWVDSPQGIHFWNMVCLGDNPFDQEKGDKVLKSQSRDTSVAASESSSKLTGGSSDYYKVHCTDDLGHDYVTECKHIIKAKNMNFNIGNVFKACFRMGDKESTSIEYDLEKQIFFALEELRRIGSIKNNQEAIKMFHKLIGEKV